MPLFLCYDSNQHFVFSFPRKNDPLGSATIPLKNAGTEPTSFELKLRNRGKPHGFLFGKIIIVPAPDDFIMRSPSLSHNTKKK